MRAEPDQRVCLSFGGTARAAQLPGGRGTSWRAGDVVLKPVDVDTDTLVWLDRTARPKLRDSRLRIALPLRSKDGAVVTDGWTATPWLQGAPLAGEWAAKADVARRLAQAFSALDPHQLPIRDDPWARADRIVWETPYDGPLRDHPLTRTLRPLRASLDIVHGDLAGNVLFDPRLPPAVIDLSLYARPVEWSVAVLAVDAVCFEGAPLAVFDTISADPDLPQYVARALLFRMTTDILLNTRPGPAYAAAAADVRRRLAAP